MILLMIIKNSKTPRPRPYWHVDAKWIAGILLFISLGASVLLYNLASITVRSQAVPFTASILANLFSKDGQSQAVSTAELQRMAANLPDGATIIPISQFPALHLTKEQVESQSPTELESTLFTQLTGLIYDHGLAGAAAQLTSDPIAQRSFRDQAGPLRIMSKQTHDQLHQLSLIAGAISLVWLALLVLFSAGWGRLVSPGVVLMAVSPAGAIAGLAFATMSQSANGLHIPPSFMQSLGSNFERSYGVLAAVGAGLLVLALFGKIVQLIIRRARHETPEFLKD